MLLGQGDGDDVSWPVVLLMMGALSLGTFVLAWLTRGARVGSGNRSRRFKTVPDMIHAVRTLTGLRGTYDGSEGAWFPRLEKFSFQGPLPGADGRVASIKFHSVTVGSSSTSYVRLSVACDEAPRIKLSLEDAHTRYQKRLGLVSEIEIGHREFDKRYLIETGDADRAQHVLATNATLREAIDAVFAQGRGLTLTFDRGSLVVEAMATDIDPDAYSLMLAGLNLIARQFQRKKLQIRRLGAEKSALVDTSGKTRCPYCRAAIVGDEETLTACKLCSTVLHEACWDEHGGCPILGCAGGRAKSTRTRTG